MISRGPTGYLALYSFEKAQDAIPILAIRHQREAGYGGEDEERDSAVENRRKRPHLPRSRRRKKGKAGMVSMYRYHQFGLGGLPLDIGLRYGSSRIREIRRARHPC